MQNNKHIIKVINNTPLDALLNPVRKFFQIQASGGIILLIVTIASLIWANSAYSDYYFDLWNIKISVGLNNNYIDRSLLIWINDGLMSVFLFLVGLEIKRELLIGELSSFKKATLPFLAAFGGMLFPAIIYFLINIGTDTLHGWGIPVATDIAFSLGILSLMQKRIPFSLKIFLTAFAIIDDIGAVLVIAIFYTSKLIYINLIISLFLFLLLVIFNLLHIRKPIVYIVPGILMWIAFFYSGVHPTVSGVLLAFTIPTVARIDYKNFLISSKHSLSELENTIGTEETGITTSELNSSVFRLEESCEKVLAPAHRIEHKLHPYVAYFIIPLFAFANAGVKIEGNILELLLKPVTLGIILGLFIGNQIGITLFSRIAIKLKVSVLPSRATFSQIYGIACLGGIGFTMSIFIATLAFHNIQYLNEAKIGILFGSLISGIAGYIVLILFKKKSKTRVNEKEIKNKLSG
jgi:Na+:H+ antiporter, NhaA family